ncbi:hypothetical protein [Actinopolyspora mortivallis]|uniref:Uncharacterized protein n=1 Tax=Actinopolyspora mortivallis TaxID=33906 RepID=A0A2T0GZX4_ACTMO|nr:hypothetical protein [Actinopolyspora mortivallis]PRW64647.1 hypothetical protein CEP50_04690 [Actinopolyspora mortivallis]
MTEHLPTTWRERRLHWHAHLRHTPSTPTLRRTEPPEAVLRDPEAGAEWVADTLTRHSLTPITIRWDTPWNVTLDDPAERDALRDRHVLAAGLPVKATVDTVAGRLYLHIDPYTPPQCPHHRAHATGAG